jgi:putative transposase
MNNKILKFQHDKRKIYNIGYHVIWTPKYRKSILKGNFKNIIKDTFFEKEKELNIRIEKFEIMSDHVHLFIKCKPTDCISHIIKHLKGYSSYKLRKMYPKFKKYKSLWSPSYYCESIGHISEETIKKYIENQNK